MEKGLSENEKGKVKNVYNRIWNITLIPKQPKFKVATICRGKIACGYEKNNWSEWKRDKSIDDAQIRIRMKD